MRSRRLLAYTPYKHQEPRLRSLKSPLPASHLADATDSPANLSLPGLVVGLVLAFVALFATAAQAQTTDPIWSTTMTIGEPTNGGDYRGYAEADFAFLDDDVGSIDNDEFSYAGTDNRVRLMSGDPRAVQISLVEQLESFDGLVLEFAGEELPFDGASIYSNRLFVWEQSWLSDNAPSLSSDFFATTLPLGGTVGVCLRTTEQTCPETASPSTQTATQVSAIPEPEVLLQARLKDVSAEHDGSTAFALQIAFNEPIETTEEQMQQALKVTGGTVTSAQKVDGRSTLWEIIVTPNGNDDVRIFLPRTTSCDADDAVCTYDGRMLSRIVAVSVPRAPLTARFENVPAGHYRTTAFALQLAFSEPIEITQEQMQQALTVTDGRMNSVQQVDDRSDLWKIAVTPDSNDDVRISLPQTTSCDADDAVCTTDGWMLSEGVAVSVARMPLTARFEDVPADHHGSTAFAVQLAFSESIWVTAPALKQALMMTGGRMIGPKRVGNRSDLWEIIIHPNATDVRIALPSTTSCDDGAVCTKDGLALQNDARAVVPFAGYVLPHSLAKVSGEDQEGSASTQLAEPFVVLVSDEDGAAIAGVAVSFTVTAGEGMLSASTDANPCTFKSSKSSITASTDANGQATTRLTLGSQPGTNTVEVTVEGLESEPFTATATEQAIPHSLTKVCGEDQEVTAGALLDKPFVVLVSDEDGAAIAGVAVSFSVTAGGGTLSATTDTTNANGHARTWLTLGSELGTNAVEATVEGLEPVTFTGIGQESSLVGFFEALLNGSGKRVALPDRPQLAQNAPNPFNSQTALAYFLPAAGPVRLEMFSLTGQRVAVLRHGLQQAGYHRLHWDGRDDAGRSLASGIYLYRLVTDEGILMRKLTLLK